MKTPIKIETMKEILKKEYGILNESDFEKAVNAMPGINLGIFTMPIERKEEVNV